MNRLLGMLAIALAFLASTSTTTVAQMLCVDRVDMLDRLASDYGEQLIEVKMMEGRGLLEVLASPRKGTWTLLLTKPDGISCVLATGRGLSKRKLQMVVPTEWVT